MTGTAATLIQTDTPTADGPTAALLNRLPGWVDAPLPRLIGAILLVAVGATVSKYVVRLLGRPVARRFERESVAQTVLRAIRLAVVLCFALVAAGLLGFRPTDIVISVTVFSAVLGVVLAPIVGNVINGLFVLADHPYEIGDLIELQDGTRGFVEEVTLRYTEVLTLDNTVLVIPNERIRDQQVVNYTAEDQRTRLSLPMLVTYECDIEEARRLLERAARRCDAVIDGGPDVRVGSARYPAAPTAYVDEYGDNGVLLTLRYWAKQPYKLLAVRSAVQSEFGALLAEEDANVEIAYPHRQLLFDAEDRGTASVDLIDGEVPTDPSLTDQAQPADETGD